MTLNNIKLIDSISELIDSLNRSHKNSYRDLIKNLDLNIEDVEGYCNWDKDNYTRNLIYLNDRYHLLILCWQQEQLSSVHDHGRQECFMYIVKGIVQENIYQLNQNSLVEHQKNIYKQGDSSYIIDSIGMHSIKCLSNRAVTLHLYAQPIEKYHVFDADESKLVCVDYVVK